MNSSYRFDIFIRFPQNRIDGSLDNRGSQYVRVFALLNGNADISAFNQKLYDLAKNRLPDEEIRFITRPLGKMVLGDLNGLLLENTSLI